MYKVIEHDINSINTKLIYSALIKSIAYTPIIKNQSRTLCYDSVKNIDPDYVRISSRNFPKNHNIILQMIFPQLKRIHKKYKFLNLDEIVFIHYKVKVLEIFIEPSQEILHQKKAIIDLNKFDLILSKLIEKESKTKTVLKSWLDLISRIFNQIIDFINLF